METKAISRETKSNLELLGSSGLVSSFYLAGGTACALYYGHRISYDLDFFTREKFVGVQDLAAMKVDALQGRGIKKDFIDLYTILTTERWSIDQALLHFQKKYKEANYNLGHILKSLVYFEDADLSHDKLILIQDYDWNEVQSFFVDQVKKYQSKIVK